MAATPHDPASFSRRPKPSEMPLEIEVLRTPAQGLSNVTCLSNDCLGDHTHFWRGRTKPCQRKHCEACREGIGKRWRGYVFVEVRRTGKIYALELTPACMGEVDRWVTAHGTLRGAKFSLARRDEKPNGKLRLAISPADPLARDLPTAPSMRKFLARLWQLALITPATIVTDEMLRDRARGSIAATNGNRVN